MTSTRIRDFEVAFNDCYQTVTLATGAVTGNYQKVVTLTGKVIWFNTTTNAILTAAPVAAAGDLLIKCGVTIKHEVWCDDTLGDGTVVVEFIRFYLYNPGSILPFLTIDTIEDGVTTYTIVGTEPLDVKKCGGEAKVVFTPTCVTATSAVPVVIPAMVKSYSILNIGENGEACVYAPIAITGDMTFTMPASMEVYEDSIQEDQDGLLPTGLTITPAAGHEVVVCWKL